MNGKIIYEGPIFTLCQEVVDGHTYDLIRHPGGVGILCVDQGRILLVRQYRPAIGTYTLEIPAGKLEYGEDPAACGMRELNEETGYECDRLELIQHFVSTPGFCDENLWIYEAKGLHTAGRKLPMDPDEDIEKMWISLDDACRMALSGQIVDGKTLITVYRAVLANKQ